MKHFIFSLLLLNAFVLSPARAEEFWPATKNYLYKYAAPCVAGVGLGYVIDRDKGVQIGSIGCIITFTYGEFGHGANRTLTNDDVEIVQDMINSSNNKLKKSLQDDLDQKTGLMNQRIQDEAQANRAMVRSTVTDLGVFLEKDLSQKLEENMKNPSLVENIDKKITEKVKDEVSAEYKSKEREIVLKTTDMVIKRVVAEPVVLDEKKDKK